MNCHTSLILICIPLVSMAGANRELAAWWYADGQITWEQQQDLDAVADDVVRWCNRVELWLGADEAQAQGCASLEIQKPKGRTTLRGAVSLDSLGNPRTQRWQAQTSVDNLRATVAVRTDAGWRAAQLERAQGAWQDRSVRMVLGDFSGSEAGLDAWTGTFRGGLAEGTSENWTGALLVSGTRAGGIHGGWKAARQKRSDLWLLMAQKRPFVFMRSQTDVIQASSRFVDPRQGSWSQARYRLPLEPLRISLGGDLHLRTGHSLPPLLDLPASFTDVRIWSSHWQEWKPEPWRLRIMETAVQRTASDSVAFSLQGERQRPAGRLAATATCRAVRTDCGLPRLELSAGYKPFPRLSDSLASSARLQNTRITGLRHTPRLRCSWDRQIGPRVRLGQSLTLPENWHGNQSLTLRQQSQMRLPMFLDTRFALRWSIQIDPDGGTQLSAFGGTLDAKF